MSDLDTDTEVNKLSGLAVSTNVTIAIKVVTTGTPATITKKQDSKTLKKQDCIIADSSACCRLVVWEGNIGKLASGNCYRPKGVGVRLFDKTKYFSVTQATVISEIDNIGAVAEATTGDVDRAIVSSAFNGEIVGARCLVYEGCSRCKVKLHSDDSIVGLCAKCGMSLKMSKALKFYTANITLK